MDATAVRDVALTVRAAIESLPASTLPITFSQFPRGSCSDTCLVLGTYLEDTCHLGAFECVSGERGSPADNTWTSHAWLQQGDWLVDITADQFSDAPDRVVVTRSLGWHATFVVTRRNPSNLKAWSGHSTHALRALYSRVKALLAKEAAAR
jgi:hypothetical protein